MNTKVEKIEKNVVKLEVTVPVERFKEALKKSYNKNASKFNVPGFRKGKVPMHMIEKYYGEGVFYEDAVNALIDETYPEALNESGITPVDYPEIDVTQIGKEVDFTYTAKVSVKPEVELGQYKGIEATKIEYPVTDEEIEAQLNSMREKNGRIVTKEEGTVENGDIAVIDFEGFVDGVAFEGGKGENYDLTIGSGSFIPGFEDQLIGAKSGESVDVNVSFPEDYQAEELKGKPALFKVTVKEIKFKELPELDDEFVKEVSEFDTLDELKADLRKKQEEANNLKAKKDYEEEIVKKAVEAAEVEIPQAMVDREIDFMLKDLDYRLQYQGLGLDKYIEIMGITKDKLKEDYKEIAATRVKTNLVLEAIAKAENIDVTDEEIENRAEEIAKMYGTKDIDNMKQTILKSEKAIIKEELANNKVVEFLASAK
jgi:trigger factor